MTTRDATTEKETPKLRIGCAQDLFEALQSQDFGVRLSVARAIAANPEKAASYGPFNGMELVDHLMRLVDDNADSSYRPVLLSALAPFGDPRIPALFMSEMEGAGDPETVMTAAARLAAERDDRVRSFMARMLRRNASTTQARMAANIMAGYEDLRPEERVRIAVVADVPFAAPALDDETEQAWLAELSADAAERARVYLEGFGPEAFLRLRGKWGGLDEDSRKWLLEWGAREHQLYSVELITETLKNGSKALVLAALNAVSRMGQAAALFQPVLSLYVNHEDRAVRIAALRAGAPLAGIKDLVFTEQDTELRLALIARLPGDAGALQALLELLADAHWEVRAAATSALIGMGEPAVSAVGPLLAHGSDKVRAAAAQILAAGAWDAPPDAETDSQNI